MRNIVAVTESWKTVSNHTFLFQYSEMNRHSVTFSAEFHILACNLMLKLLRLCNKYSGNKYA